MIKAVVTEVGKVAPALGVTWYNAVIATVPVLIMFLTLGYLALQIGYLVYKWRKEHVSDKAPK